MAANKVEIVFRLSSGVNEDFIMNFLSQHLQQQKQQENINQFTSPPPNSAMSGMSSRNVVDN